MRNKSGLPEILSGKKQLGPFPMEKLKHVDEVTTPIGGSIKRIDFRQTGFFMAATGALGPTVQRESRRFGPKSPICAAMHGVGAVMIPVSDGKVSSSRAPIPPDTEVMSRHIKSLAYFLGADIVGICRLPQWAVYSHDSQGNPIECNHPYVVVIAVDWGYGSMHGSTGDDWISSPESFYAYHTSGFIASNVAAYVREIGYLARAHFQAAQFAHYQVVLSPLAILSGIGDLSRAGWALNPFIGGRWKGAVVTTDLPLTVDKPIEFGLQKFCRSCKKCAIHCPSKAISTDDDKVERNGLKGGVKV